MKKISEEAKTSIKKLIISVVAIGLFLGRCLSYFLFFRMDENKSRTTSRIRAFNRSNRTASIYPH